MDSFDEIAFGQRLREVRGGMSRAEFAKKLGVTPLTVSKYESGERIPSVGFLYDVATMFGVNPNRLLLPQNAQVSEVAQLKVEPDEALLLDKYRKSEHKAIIQSVATLAAAVQLTNIEKGIE